MIGIVGAAKTLQKKRRPGRIQRQGQGGDETRSSLKRLCPQVSRLARRRHAGRTTGKKGQSYCLEGIGRLYLPDRQLASLLALWGRTGAA